MLVDELTNYARDPVLFWREFWNQFDLIAVASSSLAIVFRLLLDPRLGANRAQRTGAAFSHNDQRGVRDATDLVQYLDRSFPEWKLIQWTNLPDDASLPTIEEGQCPWTIELELTRVFAALGVCFFILRMLEYATFERSTGVLLDCRLIAA